MGSGDGEKLTRRDHIGCGSRNHASDFLQNQCSTAISEVMSWHRRIIETRSEPFFLTMREERDPKRDFLEAGEAKHAVDLVSMSSSIVSRIRFENVGKTRTRRHAGKPPPFAPSPCSKPEVQTIKDVQR